MGQKIKIKDVRFGERGSRAEAGNVEWRSWDWERTDGEGEVDPPEALAIVDRK